MKRTAAVFGFTALMTVIAVMLFSDAAAYIIFAAAGVLCAVCGMLRKNRLFRMLLTVCLAVCVSFLSYKASYELKYKPAEQLDGVTCTLTGTAADFPYASGGYTVLKLESCTANGIKFSGGAVFYGKEYPDIRPGDTVTVKNAELTCADKSSRFFFHSLSKGEYFSVFGGSLSVENGTRSGVVYNILSLRRLVSNRLRISLSSESFPIADALITGNQATLSDIFASRLRIAGASHIFAVSGMHLSVWTFVLFFLLGKSSSVRRITSAAGIVFVLFFIVFTGKSPSVIRSGIMLITVFVGRLLRKPPDAMNSLGLAFALCITVNPFLAGNVSFLLSTAATAAVITAAHAAEVRHLRIKNNVLKIAVTSVADTMTASAAVTVFTMVISSYFFGSASLLSGISSLLCTLPAEGAMIFGALGAAFFGAKPFGTVLFRVCETLCGLISFLIQKLSELDSFLIPLNFEKTAVLCAAMCLSAITAALLSPRTGKRHAAAAAVSLCISAALAATLVTHAFQLPQTSVYIAGGKNGDILISENRGESTVVLGMSGSYSASSDIKSIMTNDGRINADLLILSNGLKNKQKLISSYFPTEILYADGSSTLCASDETVEHAEFALSRYTVLKYTNSKGFHGCILRTADKAVAFILSGKSYPLPDEYLNADVAVFKYGLPENAENMTATKILLSAYADGDGIITAENTNGIKITASGGN